MNNIKTFPQLFESAPRIPKLTKRGIEYWKSKGKNGKDVMIYFHDDMDGIFSAVVVKERLRELGYDIKGYGVVNYKEGWTMTSLDPKMINVAVDFASMPDNQRKDHIDIYIDHHGEFTEEERELYKSNPVIKTQTASAYEGICRVIGQPLDDTLLYAIDMIDSAKYDDYGVKWPDILNFSWELFTEISNRKGTITIEPFKKSGPVKIGWSTVAKLTFAGAFNQFLKRSDHKTLIETVENIKNVSIYNIYITMKRIYPGNNKWTSGYGAGTQKEFIKDGKWRIGQMQKKTRGYYNKIFDTQMDFIKETKLDPKGYKIIGNLMFVPDDTWANALRARAILEKDYIDGVIPKDRRVDFIALQYGDTIQVCGYKKVEDIESPPVLKNGETITDLGKYMGDLLKNFQKHFGYSSSDTSTGQEEVTVSGGHVGIGTISNIEGYVNKEEILERGIKSNQFIEKYDGHKYLDLIKNKIINDLSGIEWQIGVKWPEPKEQNKDQIIREIINRNVDIQKRIKDYVSNNSRHAGFTMVGEDEAVEKIIKDEIKVELNSMDDKELSDLYTVSMVDHKVMKMGDIRKISKNGRRLESIKSFGNFINESSSLVPKKLNL